MSTTQTVEIYDLVTSKRMFNITQKIIDEEYTQVLGYLCFDSHIKHILNSLFKYLPCTNDIGFWCKLNICLNILCLKSYIFDIFLANSPIKISPRQTQFEIEYDISRIISYCENESYLYKTFLYNNFNFYRQFFLMYKFEKDETLELYQFMQAYLDVKICCDVILLHFRK